MVRLESPMNRAIVIFVTAVFAFTSLAKAGDEAILNALTAEDEPGNETIQDTLAYAKDPASTERGVITLAEVDNAQSGLIAPVALATDEIVEFSGMELYASPITSMIRGGDTQQEVAIVLAIALVIVLAYLLWEFGGLKETIDKETDP